MSRSTPREAANAEDPNERERVVERLQREAAALGRIEGISASRGEDPYRDYLRLQEFRLLRDVSRAAGDQISDDELDRLAAYAVAQISRAYSHGRDLEDVGAPEALVRNWRDGERRREEREQSH